MVTSTHLFLPAMYCWRITKINDGRYDTKSIDITNTILLKVSIDTTNSVP